MLVTVPGGTEGPGGVLVLSEDTVIWRGMNEDEVHATLPRRMLGLLSYFHLLGTDIPKDRGVLITSHVVVKQRDWFFFLLQSEYGDLYKVVLDYDKDEVKKVHVMYFDTVPTAVSMAFLKTGFLFVASESGNQYAYFDTTFKLASMFYQFQSIGEVTDTESFKLEGDDRPFFATRAAKNLLLIDELPAAHPALDAIVDNLLGEETPQIYMACGRGPRSTLRILRQGIAVSERAVRCATL